MIDCRNLTFSPENAEQRLKRATQIFGRPVLMRILGFALVTLGAKRNATASTLGLPFESLRTTLRVVLRDGLEAFEDRRRRAKSVLLPAPTPMVSKASIREEDRYLVVDFGLHGLCMRIPHDNSIQKRTLLLSMLNSGLLSAEEVAHGLELSVAHVRSIAKALEESDVHVLLDKRRGQARDYRMTSEAKALLIQQFAAHAVTGRSISSVVLGRELNPKLATSLSERTIRLHIEKLGLSLIAKSLPDLVQLLKKNSSR